MRALLIQPGARHGYALARFLHQAGALQRLYTDFAIAEDSLEHRLLQLIAKTRIGQTLSRRVVGGIPRRLIRHYSAATLALRKLMPGRPDRWHFSSQDLRDADLVYSHYFVGGPQFDLITAHGARFVSDVFIMPSAHRIGSREAARFPDWGEVPLSPEQGAALDAVTLAMLEKSDGLFCPSRSVIDDVARYLPAARAKCRLVRYGSSLSFPLQNTPIPKRVLFAGSIQLRKGPQYLALAAAKIARIDPDIRFVFAGGISAAATACLQAPNIEILGHISRDHMREEFLRADLLAFPSLAEGSAGVVLEAMAAGVPIVATREAGVDFVDGESGIIVPPTDVDALADAILRIVADRPLRDSMSRSARAEFAAYDDRAWATAFIDALQEFAGGR